MEAWTWGPRKNEKKERKFIHTQRCLLYKTKDAGRQVGGLYGIKFTGTEQSYVEFQEDSL